MASLRKRRQSYRLDIDPSSSILFIIFNARKDGIRRNRKIFEFSRTFTSIPVNRLHIRDDAMAWYLFGISKEICGIQEMASFIRDIILEHGITTVCSIGCSAGGFAAILYGGIIGADRVYAIAPQTRLTKKGRAAIGEVRFPTLDRICKRYLRRGGDPRYLEINLQTIESWSKTRFFVYYPELDTVDRNHVKQIENGSNVEVASIEGGDHHIARSMKRMGKLAPFISSIWGNVKSIDDAKRKN